MRSSQNGEGKIPASNGDEEEIVKPASAQRSARSLQYSQADQAKSPVVVPLNVIQGVDYTTFNRRQKRYLTVLIGFATMTSPLTATIYFPLLPLLRTHFHTSAQAINLTLTIYIIFQAVSPAIFGPYSDTFGRRPIYLITLLIYCAANVGLAVNQSSYPALLVLRALQSLGASAAYAVSYGVVADVCMPSERGRMLGPVSMALNLGACVGPVVGGWVAYESNDYEWCFWTLVILGFLLLIVVAAALPETARTLVGNGASRLHGFWYQSGWSQIRRIFARHDPHEEQRGRQFKPRRRLLANNLYACFRILFYRDAALSLWMHGSFYAVDYALVAATPDIYGGLYQLNELQIGLTYLTRGLGIISGAYCNGKVMDHNYRHTAERVGIAMNTVSGDDLREFPIETARSRGSFLMLVISTAAIVGYGWAVASHAHLAIPLCLQFVVGFVETAFYTIYSTLLVDTFPESPSTAAAAASIVRCVMAAAGVAVLQPLIDAVGFGWYFTVLGLWSGIFGAIVVLTIRVKGRTWRLNRGSKAGESR